MHKLLIALLIVPVVGLADERKPFKAKTRDVVVEDHCRHKCYWAIAGGVVIGGAAVLGYTMYADSKEEPRKKVELQVEPTGTAWIKAKQVF